MGAKKRKKRRPCPHCGRRFQKGHRVLRLSPDHRGALEYQGELHLSRGDIAAAEANLARLAALCPSGCEERADLAKAVVAWKAAQE